MVELKQEDVQKQDDFRKEMIPHMDAIYNFALRLTSDPNDAEDLVQDTIVKAFRFFHSYEKGTNAKAWLFRILKNSYINNYRKQSKQPHQVDYDDVAMYYESIRSEQTDTTDLESLLYRELLDDDVTSALDILPDEFKTVVLLCDVDGFTYEEIANMLDVPIGTIRSRLHRGRNLLRGELYEYASKKGYNGVNGSHGSNGSNGMNVSHGSNGSNGSHGSNGSYVNTSHTNGSYANGSYANGTHQLNGHGNEVR